MSMDLRLEGVDELLRALSNLDETIKEAQEEGLVAGADVILSEVINNLDNNIVKKRTGKLIDSMQVSSIKKSRDGGYIYIGDIKGGTYKGKYRQLVHARGGTRRSARATGRANYAYFVEFGTSTAPAYPFMRTAYANKKGEASAKMIRIVKEKIMNRGGSNGG